MNHKNYGDHIQEQEHIADRYKSLIIRSVLRPILWSGIWTILLLVILPLRGFFLPEPVWLYASISFLLLGTMCIILIHKPLFWAILPTGIAVILIMLDIFSHGGTYLIYLFIVLGIVPIVGLHYLLSEKIDLLNRIKNVFRAKKTPLDQWLKDRTLQQK